MRTNTNTKQIAILGAAAVVLTLLVAPFGNASADGGFGPSSCIEASGFDGEFVGHAGGCKPSVEQPVSVADTITLNYAMNYGWSGDADIFVTDKASGKESQVDRTGTGSGIGYLQTGGSSSGWVVEARIDGEPVARATLSPSKVAEVDDGGWVHGDASVELIPLGSRVEVATSVFAERKDNDAGNEAEPFHWKIIDSKSRPIASGSGTTGDETTKQAVSWAATVQAPRKVGTVDPSELPRYEVVYELNGETFRTSALSIVQTNPSADSSPLHFRGYGLSYNGTRLTQSSATVPRIKAEAY